MGSFGSVLGRSRIEIMPATVLSRSTSLGSNPSASPSATRCVHAPAKQSACSSRSTVRSGVPKRAWAAWPYSWAMTMATVKAPKSSLSWGISVPSSQAMMSSSGQ